MKLLRPDANGVFPTAPLNEVFDLALGNGSQFTVLLSEYEHGLMVAVCGHGAYNFVVSGDAGYVAEKLRVLEGDAANFADFIYDQIHDSPARYRRGRYNTKLCQHER